MKIMKSYYAVTSFPSKKRNTIKIYKIFGKKNPTARPNIGSGGLATMLSAIIKNKYFLR